MENINVKAETLLHIKRVAQLLMISATELLNRAQVHDSSKLVGIEAELFEKYTPMLAGLEYASPEYFKNLELLKPALQNHYEKNSHHPEHYENGVDGMNLFDIVEMFVDWKAATERHATGDIRKSIDINKSRFKMSEQLVNIFKNTADFLNF